MAYRVRNNNTGKPLIVGAMEVKRYGRLPHYTIEGECDRRGNLVGAPSTSDRKAIWVDYAVAQGADRADAGQMTKDDLIDRYGG